MRLAFYAEGLSALPKEELDALRSVISQDDIRQCRNYLQNRFVKWRNPPVELPAQSVVDDAVLYCLIVGVKIGLDCTTTPV